MIQQELFDSIWIARQHNLTDSSHTGADKMTDSDTKLSLCEEGILAKALHFTIKLFLS